MGNAKEDGVATDSSLRERFPNEDVAGDQRKVKAAGWTLFGLG